MRVVFFGTSAFAVPSLEALVRHGHEVVLCVTQPDRPRGRGLNVESSPVKRTAQALGVPLAQPERLGGRVGSEGLAPDVGVVAAYGTLIPQALLRWPAHGMLGVHPSLLPAYRGAAPVAWAILQGATQTGVSIFRLNERLDAGELICRQGVQIEPQEDAGTLTDRLARLGAEALIEALDALAHGRATFTPQEESRATFAPKLEKAQGRVVWRESAESLARMIRAVTPWPGALTMWRGRPLKLITVSVWTGETPTAAPGAIAQVLPDAVIVAAGQGALAVTEVQPADGKRMAMRAFLAGHPLRLGERFD